MDTLVEQLAVPADSEGPYSLITFQKMLNDFEELIKEITFQDVEATPEERRQMITENVRYDKFCSSIRGLFGDDIRTQDLKSIYRKISTNPDAKVDWSELFGYFQNETDVQEVTLGEEVNVFTLPARRRVGDAAGDKKRRDLVVSIKPIPGLDSYITASQKGALSVWNSKLRLQACADINESAWVTGCDYLPGIRRVAACTERSLAIWDNRAKGKNQQVFLIKPIEHSPQCMTWIPHSVNAHEDTILFGDDQGCLNMLTVTAKDLTSKNSQGDKRYSQNYTLEPSDLTYPIKRRKFHNDWVLKVKYFPDLKCFGSCSPSGTSSFVLEEIERILDDGDIRKVGISKGVNAFDYCVRANVIATGGVDKIIRVWHPHIFSRPTGKLIGHLFTVVDICCNQKDQHLISLSTARVIRVWDLHTLTNLQVFTDNEERPGEKRIYSMLFSNRHDRLLTGSSVIDCWPLTRSVQDIMQVPHTHDRPLSQILYNRELNQLLTVCTESAMRVWEAETGRQVYQITAAHGTMAGETAIEVTAIALDKSGYRLASGALDGSIKVWDFGSGQELKWKSGRGTNDDPTSSVAGLRYCTVAGERCIAALGWNNRLKLFLDSNSNYELPVLHDFSDIHYMTREVTLTPASDPFSSSTPLPEIRNTSCRASAQITNVFKKEYVYSSHEMTCMCSLESDVIATGCANGETILWDVAKSQVEKVLSLPDSAKTHEDNTPGARRTSTQDTGPTVSALSFLVHRIRDDAPTYMHRTLTSYRSQASMGEVTSSAHGNRQVSLATVSHSAVSRHPDVSISTQNPEKQTSKEAGDKTEEASIPTQEATISPEQKDLDKSVVTNQEDVKGARDQTEADPRVDPKVADDVQSKSNVMNRDEGAERDTDHPGAGEEEGNVPPRAVKRVQKTYPPVLVTCHNDSFIRFWNLGGDLLREISAVTRRQGSAVTAVCHDDDCNILVTGDHRGYLTLWDIGKFLKNPTSEDSELIQQLVCWRGHLTRIVQLQYIETYQAIVSASTDGSVRLWWGRKGRFVGFFGQHRNFTYPTAGDLPSSPVLPYDISEGPLAPVKSVSARQKARAQQQRFEYPLVFRNDHWRPFRRSAYREERLVKTEPNDAKFFEALLKPKPCSESLESFTTGEMRKGAVYRALPVYRVKTPWRPKTPEFSSFPKKDGVNHLTFASKVGKGNTRGREVNKNRRKSRQVPYLGIAMPQSRSTSATTNSLVVGPTPRKSSLMH